MSTAPESGVCLVPYPGLRPFEKAEAELLFGRRAHVKQLVNKLEDHRFLAVIGPSGCGKSSLIRAGLLPALESGSMERVGLCSRTAVMRPGGQPLANLAAALLEPDALGQRMDDRAEELAFLGATLRRGPLGLVEAVRDAELPEGTNVLVLVDQFEEIFRFHRLGGTSEANAFVDLLLASAAEPSAPIYVVLTMRSDHLGNCTVFRGLPEAMNESQFLTPRLTRDQNHAAIVGPAEMVGVEIRADVVTRILNEMGTDPDQLPLMQHLLMRMWRRVTRASEDREPGGGATITAVGAQASITMEDYEAVGGLANALSNHVEGIYDQLPDASKWIAEIAFRNLTEITPDGQEVRRPVKLAEICTVADAPPDQVVPVLDEFRAEGRSFLMPPFSEPLDSEKAIDIAHESLIRQWRQLGDWTKDEEKSRQTARVVAGDMDKWLESHRDKRALLMELRLLEAEQWAQSHPHQVEPEARDFIKASRDQLDSEARRQRLFTRLIGALAVVALVLLVVCFIALVDSRDDRRRADNAAKAAGRAAKEAEKAKVVADNAAKESRKQLKENVENKARALAGASRRLLEQSDPAGALALAVEAKNAMRTDQETFETPPEVDEARLSALGSQKREPILSPLFYAGTGKVRSIAFHPDGRWLVTGGLGSYAQLWHLDGSSHRKAPVDLDGHAESVDMVAVSGPAPWVATLDHEGLIRLWRPKPSGSETLSIVLKDSEHQASVIALCPDGRWLAAGGKDGKVWVWPMADSERPVKPYTVGGHAKEVVALAFDPGGRLLATADFAGTIQVHDLSARDRAPSSRPLNGHTGAVYSLAFSPDGRRLASASVDGSFRLWDVQGENPNDPELVRIGAWLRAIAFSPDGRRVAHGDSTGRVQVWDVDNLSVARFVLSGQQRPIGHLAFSPHTGRYLAAEDESGNFWLWDLREAAAVTISLPEANAPAGVVELGSIVPRLPAHLRGFAFQPDGRSLITTNVRGGLLSWDLSNLNELSPFDPFAERRSEDDWCHVLLRHAAGAGSASAADSAADRAGRLWLHDAADTSAAPVFLARPTNPNLKVAPQHEASAAFAPDGHTVAFSGPAGTIKLWDAVAQGPTAMRMLGHSGPPVSALAFNPHLVAGHQWLAAGDRGGTVRLWDLAASGSAGPAAELHHGGEILSLAFSPDGRWLVAGPAGGPGHAWDLQGGPPAQPSRQIGKAGRSIYALAFHPTVKNRLAVGDTEGDVLLWDLSDGRGDDTPRRLTIHDGAVTRLTFTPDGGRLISTSMIGTARLCYDPLALNSRSSELGRHTGAIFCLAVSPDPGGRWLATGGEFGDVRLWRLDADMPEGRSIAIRRFPSTIIDVAFGSDGRSLAISGTDKTVRVVGIGDNGPNPEASLLFSGQDEVTTSLVLDAEGSLLIVAGPQGSARVRPLRWLADLDQFVDRLAVRNLTASEWDQYFTKQDYRKTFGGLPIHPSLIEAARERARNGEREVAAQKLRRLAEIDRKLDIKPNAEVDLATAEGILETAKDLSRHGQKARAIVLFRSAQKLVPHLCSDPEREADLYEARGAIDEVDHLITGIRSTVSNPNLFGQIWPGSETGPSSLNSRLEDAQGRYNQAVQRANSLHLDLLPQITRIGLTLKALENDRDARLLAAEGKLEESVLRFKLSAKQDPTLHRYLPETEAQQVSIASARPADAEGRSLVGRGKIDEAVKQFELAAKLYPALYHYLPKDEAQRVATELAKAADVEGRRLAAGGKSQEAIPSFRKAHELDPGSYAYDPVKEASQAAAAANLWQADILLNELPGFVNNGIDDLAAKTFQKAKSLDPNLAYEPKDYLNRVRARKLVEQGRAAASALRLEEAIQRFREAKERDPDLDFNPEWLARRYAGWHWLGQARSLVSRNTPGAKDALDRARALLADVGPQEPKFSLDIDLERQKWLSSLLTASLLNVGFSITSAGRSLCTGGRVEDAYVLYERVREVDPLLVVPANFWNTLCWHAAVRGGAKRFGFASDLAVAAEPENGLYRDTRGLARALQGDRDGAIKDFSAYLWSCVNYQQRQERRNWLRQLREGKPIEEIFTPAVLKQIRNE